MSLKYKETLMSEIENIGNHDLGNYRISFCSRYLYLKKYCIAFLKIYLEFWTIERNILEWSFYRGQHHWKGVQI